MKVINPFELHSYLGPSYFCDRDGELRELILAYDNRRNLVLSSARRLGKTNLIQHFHHSISERKNQLHIYLDVMNTQSDVQFMNKFSSAVLTALANKKSSLETFLKTLRQIRPQASIDPITGQPTVTINVQEKHESKASFDTTMKMLIGRKESVQISIDEFQQIANYKEPTVVDATLRSYFPVAKNIHFLFSGSEEHMLSDLFNSPKKPLFASTQWMQLQKIGHASYFQFIKAKFEEFGKSIDDQIIYQLLHWTKEYTFYTHYLCNQLFLRSGDVVTHELYERCKSTCLKDFEVTYLMLKRTLTDNQWSLLTAIAMEGEIESIYASSFLNKYDLSASTVNRSIESLVQKQIVRRTLSKENSKYAVYDVFLERWLQASQ